MYHFRDPSGLLVIASLGHIEVMGVKCPGSVNAAQRWVAEVQM